MADEALKNDTRFRLQVLIAEMLGISASDVQPAALLDDLGADSLDREEIAIAIEDQMNIFLGVDDGQNWTTVADVLASVERRQGRT